MATYQASIRLADASSSEPIDVGRILVRHHLTKQAELDVEVLSGGHLLHLAVAGCLFNDILRTAAVRGIEIADLAVTADGGFGDDGSSGIAYAVRLVADADDADLRQLVADCERDPAIPATLVRGTAVVASEIVVNGTA